MLPVTYISIQVPSTTFKILPIHGTKRSWQDDTQMIIKFSSLRNPKFIIVFPQDAAPNDVSWFHSLTMGFLQIHFNNILTSTSPSFSPNSVSRVTFSMCSMHATYPAHLILRDCFPNNIWCWLKFWNSSICNFLRFSHKEKRDRGWLTYEIFHCPSRVNVSEAEPSVLPPPFPLPPGGQLSN